MNKSELDELERRAEFDSEVAVTLCKRIVDEQDLRPEDEQAVRWQNRSPEMWEILEDYGFWSAELFNALLFAARNNKPWAQKWLAYIYANPTSPEYNPTEAIRWCAKAASHGHPDLVDVPMARIVRAIHKHAEETQRYRDQARMGDAEAQFQLGFIYHDGLGVDVDKNLAVYWWKIASENGHGRARKKLFELDGTESSGS